MGTSQPAEAKNAPLNDLSPEEQEVLVEMARAGASGRIDRRALMQLAGLVGVGGLAALASGRARADASTSDSDGDIGTPSNRVDAFLDGVDAASVEGSVVGDETVTALIADGDGTFRKIWVINNGASDPAGASSDDIILEKSA